MRKLKIGLGLVLLLALGVAAAAPAGPRSDDRATGLARQLEGRSFSLAEAVLVAEREVGGRALAAQVELEEGRAVVEVIVLTGGPKPELLEIEVDGASQAILEIERDAGDGDGDGEDDDEDEDDD